MFLAILWHFHQPVYHPPGSRRYLLPWVNFHTTKNYYQMARLAEECHFPSTFNFVPCLLEQIADYACGRALDGCQLALEKRPDDLEVFDLQLLRKFVTGPIDPASLQLEALRSFFSPVDPIPREKEDLLARQKKIFQEIFFLYRRLSETRAIELTVSPYYHPLLPLIFDLNCARDGLPPAASFQYPQDGELQILKGKEYFRKTFGFYPQGMWPSEGGISRAVARSIAKAGFAFAVTDENILWKSLAGPQDKKNLFLPYLADGLTVFFRERELSDLIGFEYHKWREREAVGDFLRRVREISRIAEDRSILTLALDGENAWGAYRENGVPFLREFFLRLQEEKGLTPILFHDYLARYGPAKEIDLAAGTWQGNFLKWAGTQAKNDGWATLSRARAACGPREEILVAEGSDWFWWFGEEPTMEFRYLFDSHIEEAYRQAGVKS